MRIEFSRFVAGDLEAIGDFIAQDNPRRAVSFIQEIRDKIRLIGEGPLRYQLRPEIAADARLAVVGQHVILFRVTSKAVRIERVAFGGRDLAELLHGSGEPLS
jgi:plasmid stabilization system protein ParE